MAGDARIRLLSLSSPREFSAVLAGKGEDRESKIRIKDQFRRRKKKI
jgi:hypothetical protein